MVSSIFNNEKAIADWVQFRHNEVLQFQQKGSIQQVALE